MHSSVVVVLANSYSEEEESLMDVVATVSELRPQDISFDEHLETTWNKLLATPSVFRNKVFWWLGCCCQAQQTNTTPHLTTI